MKRSYDIHGKINTAHKRKLLSPFKEVSLCQGTTATDEDVTLNSLVISKSSDCQQSLRSGGQSQKIVTKPPLCENSSPDTFRSRITAKLQTALDCFVSELHSISLDKRPDAECLLSQASANVDNLPGNPLLDHNENPAAKVALQNFIHSAKSQISELLSKQQEAEVNSNKNRLPTAIDKSFNVDPLQTQISLKLKQLLCKTLDNKRFGNLATTKNDPISKTEWQDLSHLLQDFLNTAKRKLLHSLTSGSEKHPSTTPTIVQGGPSSVKLPSSQIEANHPAQELVQSKLCQNKELDFSSKCEVTSADNRIRKSKACLTAMESSDESDSSSRDALNSDSNGTGGILLLGESEKTPDYLDLDLEVDDSDVDDPGFENGDSDSGEEVVLLGEKRPTYQEITLDEDDEGEVYEKVVELQKPVRIPKDLEELLYDCPKCDKKFRVESLLKFHVRMHSVVESHGRVGCPSTVVASVSEVALERDCENNKDSSPQKSKSSHRYFRKEKENNKLNSKTSHKHKMQREKHDTHVRRKVKVSS